MKKYLKIILTIIVCFLLLEAITKIIVDKNKIGDIDYFPEYKKLYELTDDCRVYKLKESTIFQEGDYIIQTNNLGLRNKELSANTEKILVIGDSVTMGIGLHDGNKTFSANLEKLIGNKSIEVVNAGVPGYNLYQNKCQLDALIEKINPSIVILEITQNDLTKEVIYELYYTKHPFMGKLHSIAGKLNLFKIFNNHIYNKYSEKIIKEKNLLDAVKRNKDALEEIINSKFDYKLFILELPNLRVNNAHPFFGTIFSIHDHLKEVNKTYDKKFGFIDANKNFVNMSLNLTELTVENDWIHFNEEGHEIIGQLVYDELVRIEFIN